AQRPNYELDCPAGTVPIIAPGQTTLNTTTFKYRQQQCINSSGTIITIDGQITAKFNAEVYASGQSGATCGDKINTAAATLPANGGIVNVNQACGTGTATSPWASVTVPSNVNVRIVEQGTYWTRNITLGDRAQLTS